MLQANVLINLPYFGLFILFSDFQDCELFFKRPTYTRYTHRAFFLFNFKLIKCDDSRSTIKILISRELGNKMVTFNRVLIVVKRICVVKFQILSPGSP